MKEINANELIPGTEYYIYIKYNQGHAKRKGIFEKKINENYIFNNIYVIPYHDFKYPFKTSINNTDATFYIPEREKIMINSVLRQKIDLYFRIEYL